MWCYPSSTMKVTFFPVKTTSAKLTKITNLAVDYFQRSEPILFFVQDEAAWDFLDNLFWSTPAESFLPHPTKLIQIRTTFDMTCPTIFNLSSAPLVHESIKTLYELEDHTTPDRLKASQNRYHTYRSQDVQIIVEE